MKLFKQQTIELPLGILCKLWLEKNQENEIPFDESLTDPGLKIFTQKYIKYFTGYDNKYLVIFKELIKTLEKHESIRSHSLEVAEKTFLMLKEQGDSTLYPRAIIAGLAHDIGDVIKNMATGDHIMNSSNYISQLLNNASINDKSITFAVTNHHAPIEKIKDDNPIAIALNHTEREATPVTDPPVQTVESLPKENAIEAPPIPDLCNKTAEEPVFILPSDIVPEETGPVFDIENMMQKHEMLVALSLKVDHFGFDVFCYNETIYAAHMIVKNILLGEEKNRNSYALSNDYMAKHFGIKVNRYKLRFETAKLKKNWYFAIPLSEFSGIEIPEEKMSLPRDNNGRWLAGITPIKEGETVD